MACERLGQEGYSAGLQHGRDHRNASVGLWFTVFRQIYFPVKAVQGQDGVWTVSYRGTSSIRDGCYVGRSVTCMPPMFINVGAYVGDGTMIDSHALIGSCAQIGRNCHISAASQIGGVLEPIGALPVIIEDDVLVGGNCGVYEGTVVKRRSGARQRHYSQPFNARLRFGSRHRAPSRWAMHP